MKKNSDKKIEKMIEGLDSISKGVIFSGLGLIIENIKNLANAITKEERVEIAGNIFNLVKSISNELNLDNYFRTHRWNKAIKGKNEAEIAGMEKQYLNWEHPDLRKNKQFDKQFEEFKKPYEEEKEKERVR